MSQMNEIDLTKKANETKLNALYSRLDKLEPSYGTVRRVQAQITKEPEIGAGLKGLFIDFIECPS